MKRWHLSFNIYLTLALLSLVCGCTVLRDSTSTNKELSTVRLYMEGQKADMTTSGNVLVTSNRFLYTIEREPFLDEGELIKASIVNDVGGDGGYSIQLQFDEHGTMLLDMLTAANKGKHIIVFAQFPKPGKHKKAKKKTQDESDADLVEVDKGAPPVSTGPRESGWLAAVLIRNRISNGTFRFTPDASRPEGNRIVRGLRNVIPQETKMQKF